MLDGAAPPCPSISQTVPVRCGILECVTVYARYLCTCKREGGTLAENGATFPQLGSRISPFLPTDGAAALHVKWVKGERKVTAADRRRPAGKHRSYSNTPLHFSPLPARLWLIRSMRRGGGGRILCIIYPTIHLTGGVEEEVVGSGQRNGSTAVPGNQCTTRTRKKHRGLEAVRQQKTVSMRLSSSGMSPPHALRRSLRCPSAPSLLRCARKRFFSRKHLLLNHITPAPRSKMPQIHILFTASLLGVPAREQLTPPPSLSKQLQMEMSSINAARYGAPDRSAFMLSPFQCYASQLCWLGLRGAAPVRVVHL